MSENEEMRDKLFETFGQRMAEFAQRALNKGLLPNAFVVVCIHVDDAAWGPFLRNMHLHTGQDLQELEAAWANERAQGRSPMGVGTIMRESFEEAVVMMCPALRKAFDHTTSRQQILCLILACEGASAYLVRPQNEPS